MTEYEDLDEWSPQGPVTELTDAHARALLERHGFGRLAVSVNGQPQIFPVDYHFDGTAIVFRSAPGEKLRDLALNPVVAFEVDDRTADGAWSVVVDGRADILTEAAEVQHAEGLPLPTWIPVAEYTFVRIVPTSIRGRRFQRWMVHGSPQR
ncbi:pyridoxamine 5'-phosphate oxidase family protein [Galbitalea soli]|uniref:Pyridoxamine 5'-phosphate oxidase family protein n=1 Tax=Galbitalea soli TaxID=1268042 RepID=A0A7C9TND1_9MICO|nr:pyridoxamine 5'-phosphate oxidase family protein [Galbitalea soli]NEM90078.1 pyridoxamine 5'-phosphate oxidase family protein [Galbitalea soli]NYJ30785.1 hypothetical protein [Galbitalea soli]